MDPAKKKFDSMWYITERCIINHRWFIINIFFNFKKLNEYHFTFIINKSVQLIN